MYNRIKLHQDVIYDYLLVNNGPITETEIEQLNSSTAVPTWQSTRRPIIVAQFNNSLISSLIEGLPSPLDHWAVYRQEIGEQRQHLVAEVEKEQLFLLDYLCSNKKKYVYFVIPVTENEIGISLQSDAVSPNWYDYSITGLTEIGENIYVPYCVWNFRYNVTPSDSTNNTDVVIVDTLSRYPKVVCGDKNYFTAGLSSMLEDMDCATDEHITSPIDLYEKWESFVADGKLCLYKDAIGITKLGYIMENPTMRIEAGYLDIPPYVSFQFVEAKSTEDVSIFSTKEM